jgi:hypothetical protein
MPSTATPPEWPAAPDPPPAPTAAPPPPTSPPPATTSPPPARTTGADGAAQQTSGPAAALDVVALDGDKTSQLNFDTWPSLRLHMQRLVIELKLQSINTSQSELFNALLALGPPDAEAALRVINRFRERTGQPPR